MPDVIDWMGVALNMSKVAALQMKNTAAYLELHIEQRPVLESLKLPLATVVGSLLFERHTIHKTRQTAHAVSTPMHMRRDALAGENRYSNSDGVYKACGD